jgi:hypothetical protein
VLPRHTVSATVLWQLLIGLLSGGSIRSVFHRVKPPLALESVYHLLQRLRQRLDLIRVRLCRRVRPPDSPHQDPLLQTIEHLRVAFAGALCPVRQFQLDFQHPLLG